MTVDVWGWLGKFDENLILLASTTVQGSTEGWNSFGIPAIDASGNVFVPANIAQTPSSGTLVMMKFDHSLRLLSSATYAASAANSVMFDGSGNLVVPGWYADSSGHGVRLLIKADPNLVVISSRTRLVTDYSIGGTTLAAAGDVWEVGWTPGSPQIPHVWHYDAGFGFVGEASFTSPATSSSVFAQGLVIAPDGDLRVLSVSADGRISLFRLGQDLSLKGYVDIVSPPAGRQASGLGLDRDGRLWVTGGVNEHIWSALYDSESILISSAVYEESRVLWHFPSPPHMARDGSVLLTGVVDADYYTMRGKIWLARAVGPPTGVGAISTTSVAASSISWSWTASTSPAVTSYRVFDSVTGELLGSPVSNSFSRSSLGVGRAYAIRVAVVNPAGVSPLALSATVYTAAGDPSAPHFSTTLQRFLCVEWSAGANPSSASYDVVLSSGVSPENNNFAGNISTTTFGTAVCFLGLSPNKTYYAALRSRNSDGLANVYVAVGSTMTARLAVPASYAASAANPTGIVWFWTDVSGETGYSLRTSTGGDASGTLAADSTYWLMAGLATNTSHTLSIVALSETDVSTSTPLTRWTLAVPPSSAQFDGVYSDSATVSWSAPGNPAGTSYSASFWSVAGGTISYAAVGSSLTATGLLRSTTYNLTVAAVNGDGILSSGVGGGVALTSNTAVSVGVDPGSAQQVTFNAPWGFVVASLPSGSFSVPVSLNFSAPTSFPGGGRTTSDLTGIGVGVQVDVSIGVQPLRDVTLILPYRSSDVGGLDERCLLAARYEPSSDRWVPLVSTVDRAARRVTASTNHFSLFQVMLASLATDLSQGRIFPNPLRPALGHSVMTFVNFPPDARLRVYTLLGEFVREMKTDAVGMANWDVRNDSGAEVASGVYYVHCEANGRSRTLKAVVQR